MFKCTNLSLHGQPGNLKVMTESRLNYFQHFILYLCLSPQLFLRVKYISFHISFWTFFQPVSDSQWGVFWSTDCWRTAEKVNCRSWQLKLLHLVTIYDSIFQASLKFLLFLYYMWIFKKKKSITFYRSYYILESLKWFEWSEMIMFETSERS